MNYIKLGFLAFLSSGIVPFACAEQTPEVPASVSSVSNWTGFYGTGLIGYNGITSKLLSGSDFGDVLGETDLSKFDKPRGFAGGLELGYGVVLGKNIYLGASFSAIFSGASHKKSFVVANGVDDDETVQDANENFPDMGFDDFVMDGTGLIKLEGEFKTKASRRFDLAVQLGVAAGRFLPYVELGYGWNSLSFAAVGTATPYAGDATTANGSAGELNLKKSETAGGLLWGLGTKVKVSDNLFASLSFRQGRSEIKLTDKNGKFNNNTVLVGVGYLFNPIKK
jgi:opacity protein-like surface antigen